MELESQESLNLRINNVLFNPAKTVTTQAEYSFSFDIPSTPNNDKILGFANNLSKVNKFHARYPAEVYADGNIIFDGSLTIQKYNAKEKMYECNLVNIKINTLEEIFGDTKMADLKWLVGFDGATTINSVNSNMSSKYYFPLVSYGVFQKDYVSKDEVSATYTSKFDLDKYNKWWVESFYPSLNVVETMRKAFESKGYTAVGTAFSDPFISNIYASCNLANEQSPIYNLGNPKFGELTITTNWTNRYSTSSNNSEQFGGTTIRTQAGGIPQDLNFPYEAVSNFYPGFQGAKDVTTRMSEYNFATIDIWNMMDKKNNSNGVSVSLHQDSYIYDPTENLIVIPADGWYKIELTCYAFLSGASTTFNTNLWTNYRGNELVERSCPIRRDFQGQTPLEIQLIRNYNENVELIKGKVNTKYYSGDPDVNRIITGDTVIENKHTWICDYPHQDLYANEAPTKTEGLSITTAVTTNDSGNFGGNRTNKSAGNTINNTRGYVHKDGKVMPFDQCVSDAFICGVSSMGGGTVSVMKNGKSWNKGCGINNKVFADVDGMNRISYNGNEFESTTYCENSYNNSPINSVSVSTSTMSGSVYSCVYLNKNDILELVAVQRSFGDFKYSTSATCTLHITAMNNESYETLKGNLNWGYNSTTTFPYQLNLFNFANKETKVSDWISNIQKAFNLELNISENVAEINTNMGINKNITYAVDLDDRVSSDEAEAEFISYPKEMSVRYKIDTDEWGFEQSVSPDHINNEDWKEWGDSGYTIIQLNDDSYETSTQNTQTQFSYTWYDNFNWKAVNSVGTEIGSEATITIPVIEKSEYMADGYGYDEAMKHDGYSLTQRFWYRQPISNQYVWLSSIKANGSKEIVYLSYPTNMRDGLNLSYKDSEKSLVTEYFNIHPMLASNYVTIEVYLTPKEYESIKGGALVFFDSDLYFVSEIQAFDPSGNNLTELKLIKRV